MDSLRRLVISAVAASALAAAPAMADTGTGTGSTPQTGTTPTTATPAPSKPKLHYVSLSNETTLSRWAYTNLPLKARTSPSSHARAIAKLRYNTEDGYPEVYLALREYTDGDSIDWVEIRVPGRPNGRTAWVPREG